MSKVLVLKNNEDAENVEWTLNPYDYDYFSIDNMNGTIINQNFLLAEDKIIIKHNLKALIRTTNNRVRHSSFRGIHASPLLVEFIENPQVNDWLLMKDPNNHLRYTKAIYDGIYWKDIYAPVEGPYSEHYLDWFRTRNIECKMVEIIQKMPYRRDIYSFNPAELEDPDDTYHKPNNFNELLIKDLEMVWMYQKIKYNDTFREWRPRYRMRLIPEMEGFFEDFVEGADIEQILYNAIPVDYVRFRRSEMPLYTIFYSFGQETTELKIVRYQQDTNPLLEIQDLGDITTRRYPWSRIYHVIKIFKQKIIGRNPDGSFASTLEPIDEIPDIEIDLSDYIENGFNKDKTGIEVYEVQHDPPYIINRDFDDVSLLNFRSWKTDFNSVITFNNSRQYTRQNDRPDDIINSAVKGTSRKEIQAANIPDSMVKYINLRLAAFLSEYWIKSELHEDWTIDSIFPIPYDGVFYRLNSIMKFTTSEFDSTSNALLTVRPVDIDPDFIGPVDPNRSSHQQVLFPNYSIEKYYKSIAAKPITHRPLIPILNSCNLSSGGAKNIYTFTLITTPFINLNIAFAILIDIYNMTASNLPLNFNDAFDHLTYDFYKITCSYTNIVNELILTKNCSNQLTGTNKTHFIPEVNLIDCELQTPYQNAESKELTLFSYNLGTIIDYNPLMLITSSESNESKIVEGNYGTSFSNVVYKINLLSYGNTYHPNQLQLGKQALGFNRNITLSLKDMFGRPLPNVDMSEKFKNNLRLEITLYKSATQ